LEGRGLWALSNLLDSSLFRRSSIREKHLKELENVDPSNLIRSISERGGGGLEENRETVFLLNWDRDGKVSYKNGGRRLPSAAGKQKARERGHGKLHRR